MPMWKCYQLLVEYKLHLIYELANTEEQFNINYLNSQELICHIKS